VKQYKLGWKQCPLLGCYCFALNTSDKAFLFSATTLKQVLVSAKYFNENFYNFNFGFAKSTLLQGMQNFYVLPNEKKCRLDKKTEILTFP
jgi:hypothetical protein